MKHPKGLIPIVVVIFMTIIAAGLVGMAWYYNEHKNEVATNTSNTNAENTNENTNIDTNTNSASINTYDWQTYTNENYGFSLKYPEGYSDQIWTSNNASIGLLAEWGMNKGQESIFVVSVYPAQHDIQIPHLSDLTLERNGYKYIVFSSFVDVTNAPEEQNAYQEILGSLNFFTPTVDAPDNQSNTNQGGAEEITTSSIELDSEADSKPDYDTYFNEKTSFDINDITYPEDWNTYQNEEFGFSVKYPRYYDKLLSNETSSVQFTPVPSAIPGLSVAYFDRDSWHLDKEADIGDWAKSRNYKEYKGIVTINGAPAAHVSGDGVSGLFEGYYINHDGQVFYISASHFKENDTENNWILDAFFSSLQFLD